MEKLFKRLLVVGAHVDDPEFLAGGVLARFGANAKVVAFSDSRPVCQVPEEEFIRAMKILRVGDFGVYGNLETSQDGPKSFLYGRNVIADWLDSFQHQYDPTVVITHQTGDTHQEHSLIRDEVVRIFKNSACSIIHGYQPWNDVDFPRRQLFVKITEKQLTQKIRALREYRSQRLRARLYFDESWLQAQARFAGGMNWE